MSDKKGFVHRALHSYLHSLNRKSDSTSLGRTADKSLNFSCSEMKKGNLFLSFYMLAVCLSLCFFVCLWWFLCLIVCLSFRLSASLSISSALLMDSLSLFICHLIFRCFTLLMAIKSLSFWYFMHFSPNAPLSWYLSFNASTKYGTFWNLSNKYISIKIFVLSCQTFPIQFCMIEVETCCINFGIYGYVGILDFTVSKPYNFDWEPDPALDLKEELSVLVRTHSLFYTW